MRADSAPTPGIEQGCAFLLAAQDGHLKRPAAGDRGGRRVGEIDAGQQGRLGVSRPRADADEDVAEMLGV